jgi:uncharacterized membrane protein
MNIRRPLIVSAGLVLAMACQSRIAAYFLPGTVPLRFNANGMPTQYGGLAVPLALMPLTALALTAIFVMLSHAEPRRDNLIASHVPYATRWIGALLILAAVHLWIIYTLLATVRGAAPVDPERLFLALAGALIVIAGHQLPKLRSNFMIGIRTPWTLSNDQTWQRTHRLARLPVIFAGLAVIAAVFAAPKAILFATVMTILIATGIALVVLSYVLWHRGNANGFGV